MKRTFKTFSSLLLALVMLMSLTVTVFAADSTITYKGKGDWEFSPGSGYTSTDLFDGFKNVMPGDKRTEAITIKNEAKDSDYIKVYLQAVLHDVNGNPLTYSEGFESIDGKDQANVDGQRDETIATMHDFLSQLTMRVWNGTELIYEASPDELDGLAEPVFLADLRSGSSVSLKVELEVPIEMDNEYAYRVGEVDWKFTVEAFDDYSLSNDHTKLTAHKVWDDGDNENRPESVTVHLLRDGKFYDSRKDAEVELNADNQWTYTWSKLDDDYRWSVEEVDVPDGYTVDYEKDGNTIHVINSMDDPVIPPDPDVPIDPPDVPIDPPDVPIDPPDVSGDPVYLTVKKIWSGDGDTVDKRPESVGITLYSGKTAVETVWLGDWNNWTYTWNDLDGNGDWGALEVVPKGYTPSYSVSGRVITVTNTAALIQTGQINWPIPLLGGLGALLIAVGAYMMLRKRKNDHA